MCLEIVNLCVCHSDCEEDKRDGELCRYALRKEFEFKTTQEDGSEDVNNKRFFLNKVSYKKLYKK